MTDGLSPQERVDLLRTLNTLPDSIFEEVRIGSGVSKSVLPGNSSEPGKRSAALIDWADSKVGCGVMVLKQRVDEAVAYHRAPPSTPVPSPVPSVSVQQVTPSSPPPSVTDADAVSKPSSQPELEQTLKVNLPNSTLLELVYIPPEVFYMGSSANEADRSSYEGPQHRVKVPGFYMGTYPITQAQWYAVSLLDEVDRTLSPRPSHFKGDRRPVEQVSWFDSVEFCKRLSAYSGQHYRLPSEAEWEYACRAGTSSRYAFGDDITWKQVNCSISKKKMVDGILGIGRREIVEKEPRRSTTDVGSFQPNSFGLYDMHGNVWEWCLDHWHDNYDDAPIDGSAWIEGRDGSSRVLRGGSWDYPPGSCRSAYRDHCFPDFQDLSIGFRVVLAPR